MESVISTEIESLKRDFTGAKVALLVRIIGLFLQSCPNRLSIMRKALVNNDMSMLSREAHSLEGTLRTLHACHCAQTVSALQLATDQGDEHQVKTLLASVDKDVGALASRLDKLRTELETG